MNTAIGLAVLSAHAPLTDTSVGLAVMSFPVELSDANAAATAPVQLLPAGAFRARDGRPTECPAWICTADIAQRLIAQADADNRRIVIDYEHQTLNAEKNGLPAPAAAFFKQMEWREGSGLFATDVDWTARARQMIQDGEYRYLSPVFTYDKTTGEVLQILHAALTNFPALDNLSEVALRAAAHFQLENAMPEWLKKLLMSLGINPDNEQATTAALTALKAAADSVPAKDTEIAALKTKADALPVKEAEIAALRANAGNPDPAKFVPIETMTALQTQIAALSSQMLNREVDEIVADAMKEGKILPAQEAWAKELGNKDIASLRTFVANAPAIAALKGTQTGGKNDAAQHQPGELTESQLAVCKTMGIKPEDFKKSLQADQA